MRDSNLEVLVLAGGKGSRSANPSLPKILQEVSPGRTLLDLHLENFKIGGFKRVWFLVAYGAEDVIRAVQNRQSNYSEIEFLFLHDENDAQGTKNVVLKAVSKVNRKGKFLLILGDTAIKAPLKLYVRRWFEENSLVSVFGHPNLHTHDSDRVTFDSNFKVSHFTPKKSIELEASEGTEMAITGAIFFDGSLALNFFSHASDITEHLITGALAKKSCSMMVTSHYFKDSGTQKRLENIQSDLHDGSLERRGKPNRNAIFLDRDGTIIPNIGTERRSLDIGELRPNIASAIRRANKVGVSVFLVTNQPGIAKGQIGFGDVYKVHNQLQLQLEEWGAFLDEIVFCPHHPEIGFKGEVESLKVECDCRKPRTGLLTDLAERHCLNLGSSIFIGDSVVDKQAAEAAGMNYLHADCRTKGDLETANIIEVALERVLK